MNLVLIILILLILLGGGAGIIMAGQRSEAGLAGYCS
jgi:hypothetical protein